MKKIIFLAIAVVTLSATFAQKGNSNSKENKTVVKTKTIYTCPMHPEVTSDKPGKCSKCGMDLVKSKKDQMKKKMVKIYTCPMHPEIISDKPGKCSKCGMNLKESEKEMASFSCPMHPEITSDKPGKCSKCGMDLKENKEKKLDHTNHKY